MTLRLVHPPSTGATQLVCHYLSSAVPQLTLSSSACGDRAAPRGLVISNQMKRNVGSFRCVAKCFVRGETDKPTVNSASCVITTGHPAPHHCHPPRGVEEVRFCERVIWTTAACEMKEKAKEKHARNAERKRQGDASSGGSPPRPSGCHGFVLATSQRFPCDLRAQH